MWTVLETFYHVGIICLMGFFGGILGVAFYAIMGWPDMGSGFWPGAFGLVAGAYLEELSWRRKFYKRLSSE